ncbi:MAG: alginate O-acetyltransferase AlgX-related protein, partial [Roseimicrobium sp.]
MAQHVPANPYPEEKDTTVYAIGRGVSLLVIAAFFLLVSIPVVSDHLARAPGEENGVKTAQRRAFWFEAWQPPAFDPETPSANDKKLVHHLRWLERGLDKAVYATAIRQHSQQWLSSTFGEGNQKVFAGFDGWLFYLPDIKALTGYGPLKPEPFSVMKDPELAKVPAASACIEQFAAQLQARGVSLLLVPVPLKPMLYNEYIATGSSANWLKHPDAEAFYDGLRSKGVDVLDLTADFAKLRGERKHVHYLEATSQNREIARQTEEALKLKKDAFLKQDTHWTPDAMRLAAEKIAQHVKAKYPHALRPMARTIAAIDG